MKKITLLTATFLAVIALNVSCKKANAATPAAEPAVDMAEVRSQIESQNDAFVFAMNKGDAIGVAKCYTKDAKFMQPNASAVSGRENIQKLFESWMKAGPMPNFSLKNVDTWGSGDMIVVENQWAFTDQNGKEIDHGKSLELWKKEDESWKLFRDCYNSDLPAAVPSK